MTTEGAPQATPADDAVSVGGPASRIRRPRRTTRAPQDDRPCRKCGHYDCRMDRGEPLPPGVRAYQDGVRYHDAATRTRAREEAIRTVDGRHGYSIEFAADPAAHEQDWRAEEERLLAAWDTTGETSSTETS